MGDGDQPAVSTRARRLLGVLLVPLLAATVAGAVAWWPDGSGPGATLGGRPVDATVVGVRAVPCADGGDGDDDECVRIEARVADGGTVALELLPVDEAHVEVGDDVVLRRRGSGADVTYALGGPQREPAVAVAAVATAAVLLLVARWWGLRLLVALAASFVVLVAFAAPAVRDGAPDVGVAAVGGALVATSLVVVGRGVGVRRLTALAASLLAVGVGAGTAALLTGTTRLAAFDPPALEQRSLLLVGVVIGATGAVVDLACRVVDAAWADPDGTRWWARARAAARRGLEPLAGTGATLALAYAGVALPVLLLLDGPGRLDDGLVNGLAPEVVRVLAGLVAVALVVPLTAALAAAVLALGAGERRPSDPRRFRTRHERDIWG